MDEIEPGEWVAVAECGPLEVLEVDDDGSVVVDDRGELVGLISRTDVMTAFNVIQSTGSLEPARETGTADRAD